MSKPLQTNLKCKEMFQESLLSIDLRFVLDQWVIVDKILTYLQYGSYKKIGLPAFFKSEKNQWKVHLFSPNFLLNYCKAISVTI